MKNIESVTNAVNKEAICSLLAIANPSSEVGYGNIIKTLGDCAILQACILAIPGSPLLSLAASTSILASISV